MQEEWRRIRDFPDYEVSSRGRVLSYKRREPRILRLALTRGCPAVRLRAYEKTVHWYVSRLVLTTFVGPPPCGGMDASHANGDRTDNRLENLLWETRKDNNDRKWHHGTQNAGERCNFAKLSRGDVALVRYLVARGYTQASVAAMFDVTQSNVSLIVNQRRWGTTRRNSRDRSAF